MKTNTLMENDRKVARWTGILFLIPLLAYSTGNACMEALRADASYLATIGGQSPAVAGAALLLLLNSVAVVAIAVLLYPLLARQHTRVALAYLCTRVAEALLLTGGLLALLLLPSLGEASLADPADGPLYQSLAGLAVRTNFLAFQVAMLVLGLGSVVFCGLLWRIRMVPRAIALWGVAGYGLLGIGAVLELFDLPWGVLLSLPGGLFEVGLGVWLIVKGFRAVELSA